MADIDFYGYSRQHPGKYLYSSDVAAIYFDNNCTGTVQTAGLVQNVTANYQHSVLPRFEAGSSELYWVTGQAQGSVGMGRLISSAGLLQGVNPGASGSSIENGILGDVQIKIGKQDNNLRSVNLSQNLLIMRGCVLSDYSCSFTTGALEVSESIAIKVALMKRDRVGGDASQGGGSARGGMGDGVNSGVGSGGGMGHNGQGNSLQGQLAKTANALGAFGAGLGALAGAAAATSSAVGAFQAGGDAVNAIFNP